jgi:drug/metabolite transporter (DMT)-like permease
VAWLLLKEKLDGLQIIGVIAVIIGIGLVQWTGKDGLSN